MSPASLRLTGTLGRHAEAATATDGSAWLTLEIHQGRGSIAAACRKAYGVGPAAQIAARSAAHHLRAGTRVTVHATGFEIRHRPSDHLWLLGVHYIEHQATAEHA